MKKALTYISFNNILLIFLLTLSGFFSGILSDTVYFLAFIIPIGIYVLLLKKLEVDRGKISFVVKKRETGEVVSFVFPVLALIFFISWLTSLVLSFISSPPKTDVSGNIFKEIAVHALIPSVLEEFVFRYFPLRLLMPHSKRCAVIISSLIFGLVHGNAFKIPYALVAGLLFAILDVAYESVLPSLVLHFLNNVVSILWMRNNTLHLFVTVFVIVLAIGTIASVVFLLLCKGKPFKKLSFAFINDGKLEFTYPFVVFMALLISIVAINASSIF